MKCIILLLSLCTTVQLVEGQCPSSMECRPYQQCPGFVEQRKRLVLTLTKGTDEHTSLHTRLRSQVCNNDPLKVCCDTGKPLYSIGSGVLDNYVFNSFGTILYL